MPCWAVNCHKLCFSIKPLIMKLLTWMPYLFLILTFFPQVSHGQEITRQTVGSNGSNFAQPEVGSIEYSVGQLLVLSPDSCSVTYGFHQTFLADGCVYGEEKDFDGEINIFPNPTMDLLNIEVKEGEIEEIILFDNLGQIIGVYTVDNLNPTSLDLGFLLAGHYMMYVITSFKNHSIKFLKIN